MTDYPEMVIQKELKPNERLLWSSKPKGGIIFRRSDIFQIPISILAAIFILNQWYHLFPLMLKGIDRGIDINFLMFYGILIYITFFILYLLLGRFFLDKFQREKTYYGLTSNRILIIYGMFQKKVKSLDLSTISAMCFAEKLDKSGTITFGVSDNNIESFIHIGTSSPGMYQIIPEFELIDNVKTVYEMIQKAKSELKF